MEKTSIPWKTVKGTQNSSLFSIIDASDPACFEYVGGRHCETGVCYHCKCEKCGRLFHVSAGEMNALSEYLEKSQNFILDPKRTVFYGLCRSCA